MSLISSRLKKRLSVVTSLESNRRKSAVFPESAGAHGDLTEGRRHSFLAALKKFKREEAPEVPPKDEPINHAQNPPIERHWADRVLEDIDNLDQPGLVGVDSALFGSSQTRDRYLAACSENVGLLSSGAPRSMSTPGLPSTSARSSMGVQPGVGENMMEDQASGTAVQQTVAVRASRPSSSLVNRPRDEFAHTIPTIDNLLLTLSNTVKAAKVDNALEFQKINTLLDRSRTELDQIRIALAQHADDEVIHHHNELAQLRDDLNAISARLQQCFTRVANIETQVQCLEHHNTDHAQSFSSVRNFGNLLTALNVRLGRLEARPTSPRVTRPSSTGQVFAIEGQASTIVQGDVRRTATNIVLQNVPRFIDEVFNQTWTALRNNLGGHNGSPSPAPAAPLPPTPTAGPSTPRMITRALSAREPNGI